jgi:hypothetical protein
VIVCRPSKGSSLDFEEIGSVPRDAALLKVAIVEGIVAVLVCRQCGFSLASFRCVGPVENGVAIGGRDWEGALDGDARRRQASSRNVLVLATEH